MAAVLDSESQETASGSVDTTAAGMCGAMGNLLDVASENAAVNQPNSTNLTSSQGEEQQANSEINRSKVGVWILYSPRFSI